MNGNFHIFNADCLTKMKDISSNSVDLIICDLPFGCLHPERKRDAEKWYDSLSVTASGGCAWDVKIDLDKFWKEVKRIRRNEHSPVLHFTTTRYGYELIKSNEKEFRYDLVWNKERGVSFLAANRMPMRSHEMVYVFSKAGAYYNRIDVSGGKPYQGHTTEYDYKDGQYVKPASNKIQNKGQPDGKRCIKSVIEFVPVKKRNGHPTEKPVELYKFLIERYCPPGGTVLDPTFGSGNSGLASLQLGRKYLGIEKDKEFFDKFHAKFQNLPTK